MSAIASPSPTSGHSDLTPDDLLTMDGLFELVDGRLVEKHMSFEAGDTAVKVILVVGSFVQQHNLGKLASEVTFRCFPEKASQVRRPDIAFIMRGRLSLVPKEGHVPVRPDIAIEIVSPGDEVYELDDKLADYESAETPLVWILNPNLKTVAVHRPHQPTIKLRAGDQLSGEPILPGFSVRVGDLFPTDNSAV